MQKNNLYEDIKSWLKEQPLAEYTEFHDSDSTLSIAVTSNIYVGAFTFTIESNLYSITLRPIMMFNQIEEQNITKEDIANDIRDIFNAVRAGSVVISQYNILGKESFRLDGLNPSRFIRTYTFGEALIAKLGKFIKKDTLTLEPPNDFR